MGERGADGVIDFYFDFISPYGYFAAMQIEALARRYNYTVRWHAFRVGVLVVKVMGLRPLLETPLKNEYVRRDIDRLSTMYGLPVAASTTVPDPVFLGSAFYAVEETHADSLPGFAKQLYARIWTCGAEVGDVEQLLAVARFAGLDGDRLFSPGAMETGRRRLKAATDDAIARGVFGSPTFVVGDEVIWGVDRLWMLEHFLQKPS
jgi:2-hydroxychromene-2-carboxylate isomerase